MFQIWPVLHIWSTEILIDRIFLLYSFIQICILDIAYEDLRWIYVDTYKKIRNYTRERVLI